MPQVWKKCSNCKRDIFCGSEYQVCSVSTCNNARTGLQFCSTSCWSAHVPILRHKDAWAVEETAPMTSELPMGSAQVSATSSSAVGTPTIGDRPGTPTSSAALVGSSSPGAKRIITPAANKSGRAVKEKEVLIVVSKLKAYINDESELSTSADVIEKLSDHLRELCDRAIEHARTSGRKTVMARDFLV